MANILIVYGTTEGHTRKIAQHVGGVVRSHGHDAEVVDSADVREALDLKGYDAFVLAGSLHQGAHQRSLVHFVKVHREDVSSKPSAFLSVSLTAVNTDEEHQLAANKCVKDFTYDTGWTPKSTCLVAGALKYVEYDWFKRMIMKSIVKKEGGDIDTSQDYEYTDWDALDTFVTKFLQENFSVVETK